VSTVSIQIASYKFLSIFFYFFPNRFQDFVDALWACWWLVSSYSISVFYFYRYGLRRQIITTVHLLSSSLALLTAQSSKNVVVLCVAAMIHVRCRRLPFDSEKMWSLPDVDCCTVRDATTHAGTGTCYSFLPGGMHQESTDSRES
jgi:hypothetical protein